MYLKPSEIFYTQATVYENFGKGLHYGCSVEETWQNVRHGRIRINQFPTIEVIFKYGKYWSMDNRRLWIFKNAEDMGICREVEVRMGYVHDYLWKRRFTTVNGGTSVTFRKHNAGMRCEFCSEWFRTPDGLMNHVEESLPGHKIRCHKCKKEYTLPADFEEHKHNSCRKPYSMGERETRSIYTFKNVNEENENYERKIPFSQPSFLNTVQYVPRLESKTLSSKEEMTQLPKPVSLVYPPEVGRQPEHTTDTSANRRNHSLEIKPNDEVIYIEDGEEHGSTEEVNRRNHSLESKPNDEVIYIEDGEEHRSAEDVNQRNHSFENTLRREDHESPVDAAVNGENHSFENTPKSAVISIEETGVDLSEQTGNISIFNAIIRSARNILSIVLSYLGCGSRHNRFNDNNELVQ